MWRRWIPIIVFIGALVLYLRTLAPGVFVSDFAEFQYQPAVLGLPHPNGFPLYMLLGWLWSWLPISTVAWRMNALSAVGGALAAALTAGFALRLSQRSSVALLAAGLLALSPTFWYYSLAAERYTLNLALLVGALWTAWEAAQRQDRRLAYLSALLIGLGWATHPSDALFAPFWLAYLVWRLPAMRRQPAFWAVLALCLLAPLALYAYVPWRWAAFSAQPMLPGVGRSSAVYHGLVQVWYQPQLTLSSLRDYILGLGGYATGFLAGGWTSALAWLADLAPVWKRDAPAAVLALSLLGALRLLRRDAALTLALAGFAGLVALMTAYITQGKPEAYLLPTTWATLFCAAFALDLLLAGMGWLARRRAQPDPASEAALPRQATLLARADAALTAAVAIGLLIVLVARYPALDHSRWSDSQRAWDVTLEFHDLPTGAALLGHWSDMTPLWYMQQVDGRRPDLVGLFPPDPAQVIQPWLEAGGALYLAGPLNEYAPNLAEDYELFPWGKLVRILLPGQRGDCPALAQSVETPAAWPFAIDAWEISAPLTSDQPGALRFCWQARSDLPPDTFLKLSLRPADGSQAVEINTPLLPEWRPATAVAAGAQGLAVAPIHLPPGARPGAYGVELMPYRLLADGSVEAWPDVEPIVLGETTVALTQQLARSQLGDELAPLLAPVAGPLRLRAWQVSSLPVRPGDPVQVDLLWQVREPLEASTAVALGWRSLPSLRSAATPQTFELPAPAAGLPAGALLRTSHVLDAPRSRGDQTYLLEARLQAGGRWLDWRPTLRLPIGVVRVQDRPHLDSAPAHALPVEATFGDLAGLAGYAVEPAEPRPGDSLAVTLYWRPAQETEQSYTVFVHLVNGQGQIVAQHDGIPANAELPTNIWVSGEVIADRHTLPLPAGLPSGAYSLRVGLYDAATGERLPVESSLADHDRALEIGQVRIEAP